MTTLMRRIVGDGSEFPSAAKAIRAMRWLTSHDGWRGGKRSDGTVVVYACANELWDALTTKLNYLIVGGPAVSRFVLTIRTDNDAFTADRNNTVARLLVMAAHSIDEGQDAAMLHDPNGNPVGDYYFETTEEGTIE